MELYHQSYHSLFFLKNIWMKYQNDPKIDLKNPVILSHLRKIYKKIDRRHLTYSQKSLLKVISISLNLTYPSSPPDTSRFSKISKRIFKPIGSFVSKTFFRIYEFCRILFILFVPILVSGYILTIIFKKQIHQIEHFENMKKHKISFFLFSLLFKWFFFARYYSY